ncbi:hypothetical protein NQ314_008288 [Rhamnusium bicolor]|uniref:Cytochrome P450 n=1 Tax=Rhamnusium bicolor TaxID=1586634 RepID=A0AAV8YD00_9CUCU|nr:hypothetical protein NQ314_008288 [Rhamnusium bicolor]
MGETISSYIKFYTSVILKPYSWTVFELLSVALLSTFFVWYIQFLWSRRKLYKCAKKMEGPLALPLIGCALYFIGSPYDIYCNIMTMFNKYPKIFRVWFGPRLFCAVSEPKYFEILLPNFLRKEHLYHHAECVVGYGLFTAPLDIWKRHRKIIMPTFNQKILDSFVDIFSQQANVLVEQLKTYSGKEEFDVFHVVYKCTLDIICETAMGVKVNTQTTDFPYPKWVDRIFEIVFLRIFVFWYHFDSIFNFTPLAKETTDLLKNLHEFSGVVNTKKKAFLDYLIELTSDENSKFTEQELREEVDTFIIAEKVYDELIEILGPDRSVEPADLPKLSYMDRFLKETLRLFPVAPFIVRAIDEDVDLGDHIIPADTSVVFGILKAHTDEEYWPEPFKFDPDRFLPEEVAKRHPCAYVPFSYGSRNCIG